MFKFKTFSKILKADEKVDAALHKEVASHIDVTLKEQPDLLFFKAVYLTEGMNKNGAIFTRDQLVNSIDSIYHKGMDIEHEEHEIVGHIYAAAFADAETGTVIAKEDVKDYEGIVDVVIGGIVYRDRFPELAEEIEAGEWYVSMETYFKDYQITVGELVFDRETEEASKLEAYVGSHVTVKDNDAVIADGVVGKILIGLHFCGGGFVKTPANPTSIIFETANDNNSGTKVVDVSTTKNQDKQNTPPVIKISAGVVDQEEDFEMDSDVKEYISTIIDECKCMDEVAKAIAELSTAIESFTETAAKWSTAYINKLPDSAFIIIEPAYKQGKTKDKRARHLPYKDDKGKVDLPHLRNAAARCNQLKPVTDSISADELRKQACKKVQELAKKYLKSSNK